MPATQTPDARHATHTATTEAGTFRAWRTGSELWEDDGTTRQTLTYLVQEPSGNTYGYFASDLDAGRKSFFARIW